MSNLSKRDRLRRVALLGAHFARNLAYYRASSANIENNGSQYWITTQGNFLDIAVMEWCKLFGEKKGRHCWRNIVEDPSEFEEKMLLHLSCSKEEFETYIKEIRTYRDKFVAHLDSDLEMNFPDMGTAKTVVFCYYSYIVEKEASLEDLVNLPDNIEAYYNQCFEEASSILLHRA